VTFFEDSQFQNLPGIDGIIALAHHPSYAVYNGKMERDLKEILEWLEDHKTALESEFNENLCWQNLRLL